MPVPVTRFEFATRDTGAAHDVLQRLYTGYRFSMQPATRDFSYRQETVTAGPIAAGRVRYTMDVSVRLEPSDSLIFVAMAGGRIDTRDGREVITSGPGDVILHRPGRPRTTFCHDFDVTSLRLDPGLVADVAAARTGIARDDFRFDGMTPVSPTLAAYWRDTMAYLHRFLTGPAEPLRSPLAISAAADLGASAALVAFPHSAAATRTRPAAPLPPAAVRRAVSYIESHAAEPITAAWIAESARIGPRALQAAFRRHLDTTPMAYLRRVRLSRAHLDLLHADPSSGGTVAAIARRWGYLSLSHFAADYRTAYGRPPRDTLRH